MNSIIIKKWSLRALVFVMLLCAYTTTKAQTTIDFTVMPDTDSFGTNSQKEVSPGVFALWAGDANGNGEIKLKGSNNDALEIKSAILNQAGNSSQSLNYTFSGYEDGDTNMDGIIDYRSGSDDDYERILESITCHTLNKFDLLSFIIIEQLP